MSLVQAPGMCSSARPPHLLILYGFNEFCCLRHHDFQRCALDIRPENDYLVSFSFKETMLAPREHPGGPLGRQDGHLGVRNQMTESVIGVAVGKR